MESYDHNKIEKKWQKHWEESRVYRTRNDGVQDTFYVLDMFPYPSGSGLHVGHPRGYIATDVYSRYHRMRGYNVLHPMGWDAFGLPAENYAIKNKIHPAQAVAENVARYKEQLSSIGFDYDWEHEVNTTDPEFYRWTQWQFLQFFKAGLAYQSHEPINWCPSCQTGLANEDLESDGTCERCGSQVEQRRMRQWMLRITDYADRLLDDLELLPDWPESVKESQRNWIGRSKGAEITFRVQAGTLENDLKVFTTRPDTLFGATYMVVAPEHPLIHGFESEITNLVEVRAYVQAAQQKTDIERTAEGKEKTGVRLEGVTAINPANQEEIPVFVADYVLGHYGTGAIMAVPAHDERDFAFAEKYSLPVRTVVEALDINIGPGNDAYRDGVKEIERYNVVCIIEHPTEDKFLCADWKQVDWRGFVTGGLDGDTAEQTAIDEVREETGYQSPEIVRVYDHSSHGKFYHVVKEHNRLAHYQIVHVKLRDLEYKDPDQSEKDIADFVWVNGDQVEEFLTREDMKYPWRIFRDPNYVFTGSGLLVNSGQFTGMDSEEAKQKITESVGGKITHTYRLNDWVFSRQRYWGEPIPVVHAEDGAVYPVAAADLPVMLPRVSSYEPTGTGESPLAAIDEWVNVTGYLDDSGEFVVATEAPAGKTLQSFKRETNTMPNWAGSSWYYIRYIDPRNTQAFIDPIRESKWLPVDMYVGGVEHATRHLIYARFWHKFLYDQGLVSSLEPFARLRNQGLIQAEDGRKMSKRWGNVINPDDVVHTVGADALRLYEMFIAPFENSTPWSTDGLAGTRRFLERVWRQQGKITATAPSERTLHKTIKKVTTDIEQFKFNTAVSAMMVLVNVWDKLDVILQKDWDDFLKILAPFAPHISEELWQGLGHTSSIHLEGWPEYDESLARDDEVTIGIQINGKVRAEITLAVDADREEVQAKVLALPAVQKHISGELKQFIYVPGRIISIVV